MVECQICGRGVHSVLDCHHKNNFVYQGTVPPSSLTTMQDQALLNFLPNDSWIVDT